jgi:ribosomal protein S18 acetylase RimI-like enzyme
MTKIRAMEHGDVSFALRLTNTEGWGFTRQDFLRLLKLGTRGCFVALKEKQRIGIITTTKYDDLAWIGNVIVAKALRGQRVGIQLLERAISHIEAEGINRIGLYSYPHTRPLYRSLGFSETAIFVRYLRTSETMTQESAKLSRRFNLKEIARFDKDRFGADRTKLLRQLSKEFRKFFFVFDDGNRISGYVIAKGAQSGYEIGPCISDYNEPAMALLNAELNQMKGKKVEITVPMRNRFVTHAFSKIGFSPVGQVHEMYRGALPRRRLETIFAVGGLEKG